MQALTQTEVQASQTYCLLFLIYLFDTPDICTHTQPCTLTLDEAALWRSQLKRKRGISHICYCWGDRLVFISTALHMHLPSSPFILSSSRGEETHQLMFSFTVIGWFKAASVNCAPVPTALHLRSAILLFLGSPSLPRLLFALDFFSSKWSNGLCVRVLAGWWRLRDFVKTVLKKREISACGGLKSPRLSPSSASTFRNINACLDRACVSFPEDFTVWLMLLCDANNVWKEVK